jgi:hypothetical protein
MVFYGNGIKEYMNLKLPERKTFYLRLIVLNFLFSTFLMFIFSEGEQQDPFAAIFLLLGVYILNFIISTIIIIIYEIKASKRKFNSRYFLIIYIIVFFIVVYFGVISGFNAASNFYPAYSSTLKSRYVDIGKDYADKDDLSGCLKYFSNKELRHSDTKSFCYTPFALKNNDITLCNNLSCQIEVYNKIALDRAFVSKQDEDFANRICSNVKENPYNEFCLKMLGKSIDISLNFTCYPDYTKKDNPPGCHIKTNENSVEIDIGLLLKQKFETEEFFYDKLDAVLNSVKSVDGSVPYEYKDFTGWLYFSKSKSQEMEPSRCVFRLVAVKEMNDDQTMVLNICSNKDIDYETHLNYLIDSIEYEQIYY